MACLNLKVDHLHHMELRQATPNSSILMARAIYYLQTIQLIFPMEIRFLQREHLSFQVNPPSPPPSQPSSPLPPFFKRVVFKSLWTKKGTQRPLLLVPLPILLLVPLPILLLVPLPILLLPPVPLLPASMLRLGNSGVPAQEETSSVDAMCAVHSYQAIHATTLPQEVGQDFSKPAEGMAAYN